MSISVRVPGIPATRFALCETGDAGQGPAGCPIGVRDQLSWQTAALARRHAEARRVTWLVPSVQCWHALLVRAAMSERQLTMTSCGPPNPFEYRLPRLSFIRPSILSAKDPSVVGAETRWTSAVLRHALGRQGETGHAAIVDAAQVDRDDAQVLRRPGRRRRGRRAVARPLRRARNPSGRATEMDVRKGECAGLVTLLVTLP